jgi:hypothetical protein
MMLACAVGPHFEVDPLDKIDRSSISDDTIYGMPTPHDPWRSDAFIERSVSYNDQT